MSNEKTPEEIAAEKQAEKERIAAEKAEAKRVKAEEAAQKKAEREAAKAAKAEEAAAKKAAAEAERERKKAEAEAAREASKQPIQNGIRRPKPDGKCGQAWAVFDAVSEKNGSPASIGESMEIAKAEGQNEANVRAEYARWRKFHGLSGRIDDPAKVAAREALEAEKAAKKAEREAKKAADAEAKRLAAEEAARVAAEKAAAAATA
jgi:hypothetical protein